MESIQEPSSTIIPQPASNETGWNLATSRSGSNRKDPQPTLSNPRKRAHFEDVEENLYLHATCAPSENDTTEAVLDTSARVKAIEFIKYWLVMYPETFPQAKQIQALGDLCSIHPPFVEALLNHILREQPLRKPDVIEPRQVVEPPAKRMKPRSRTQLQNQVSDAISDPTNLDEVALWVKEHPPKRRSAVEPKLLPRDATKLYQCTQSCGMSFGRKDDWRRHEEQHHPQEGWICDLDATAIVNGILICSYCDTQDPETDHAIHNHRKRVASNHCKNKPLDARGRIFYRKEHFLHHLEKIHPSIPSAEYITRNHFVVDSSFPRLCGFCVQYQFRNWQDRIEHLGRHFEDGEIMSDWKPTHFEDLDDNKDSSGEEMSSVSNFRYQEKSSTAEATISRDNQHLPTEIDAATAMCCQVPVLPGLPFPTPCYSSHSTWSTPDRRDETRAGPGSRSVAMNVEPGNSQPSSFAPQNTKYSCELPQTASKAKVESRTRQLPQTTNKAKAKFRTCKMPQDLAKAEVGSCTTVGRKGSTNGFGNAIQDNHLATSFQKVRTLRSPKSGNSEEAIGADDPDTSTISRVDASLALP